MELFRIDFLVIRVVDLIDIGIVAFVLYRLYASMRGTIAAQIFVGLALIIGAGVVSQFLEMKLLSWVLQTVSAIWVIALIILFQPELRRILLILGRQGFTMSIPEYDIEHVVTEIVQAAKELSERRFGGLIVVTRATDLSFAVETGVRVGASLSKELLMTIFNPKSPLHDGAVIVDGERIESARVILPFSTVMKTPDQQLGTRHRAGLGVSEHADVFVVIVSEETGFISYAMEGNLYYNKSAEELKSVLRRTLTRDRDQQDLPLWRRLGSILPGFRLKK
ncbi:MAG: diadenylate cyclase CdaA [Ignavibacteriae bacterium]|nr:diadenylate cyclase CdaA [Ignavibacteriota bacterium]MCB9217061.1 TIGR00159 family protein [Ignavibacteria bacterium]